MFVLTNSPKEFVPSSEKGKEKPLTFICIPPTRKAILDLQEMLVKSLSSTDFEGEETEEVFDGVNLPISKMMELYLDVCVTDWKNVTDEKGNEIPFSKEIFKSFNDTVILMELYNFIKGLAEIDPLVEKS